MTIPDNHKQAVCDEMAALAYSARRLLLTARTKALHIGYQEAAERFQAAINTLVPPDNTNRITLGTASEELAKEKLDNTASTMVESEV